ncbi:TasA family protein [Sutcliffiella cohnii]|uniref:TasA family protein n=1 Tax=Sutcliffiella cohnii TaxID=33932 RepID=UPI002E251841|nr:TasA family protein [Sutcliffiella cohnii]
MNAIVKLIMYSALLILIIQSSTSSVLADSNENEIDIRTSPEKILFELDNMKPGDWVERSLVITNSGTKDFKYLSSASLVSGSEKFYNALILSISDKSGQIFNGSLEDFKALNPREIVSGGKDELLFKVEFPYEKGNEYQGLASIVEFKFYAEGTLGGVSPVDGVKLPKTATNILDIILIGVIILTIGTFILIISNRKKRKMQYE